MKNWIIIKYIRYFFALSVLFILLQGAFIIIGLSVDLAFNRPAHLMQQIVAALVMYVVFIFVFYFRYRYIDRVVMPNLLFLAYKNYKGETKHYLIFPLKMWYGKTKFHPFHQWMLKAYKYSDKDGLEVRNFAMRDIICLQHENITGFDWELQPSSNFFEEKPREN